MVNMSKKRVFTSEEISYILEEYANFKSMDYIRKQLKTKSHKIREILVEHGVRIRSCTERQTPTGYATNKKYTFNQDYFEVINTAEKAYWLGFLFADGCVNIRYQKNGNTKGGSVSIQLQREDDYHLRNFVIELQGNMPVRHEIARCNGKEYETARLQIHSIKMCNDLINLGCVPRKSLVLEPPKHLNEKYNHAFIKGYFDGDGCIGYYPEAKNSKMFLSIMGTKTLLDWMFDLLERQGISSMRVKQSSSKTYQLEIYGRSNMCKFYNYIYGKSTYVLERKNSKFRTALLELNQPLEVSDLGILAELM
jgi:hypothetical protein